jgi:hypothetical protein
MKANEKTLIRMAMGRVGRVEDLLGSAIVWKSYTPDAPIAVLRTTRLDEAMRELMILRDALAELTK